MRHFWKYWCSSGTFLFYSPSAVFIPVFMLLGQLHSVLHGLLSDTKSPLNSLIPMGVMIFFIWNSDSPLPTPVSWSSPTYRFSVTNSENSHFTTPLRKREDWVQFCSFSTAHCVPQAARFLAGCVSQVTFTPWLRFAIISQMLQGNTLLTCKLGLIMALLKIESSSVAG